jgi:hypothetical protein
MNFGCNDKIRVKFALHSFPKEYGIFVSVEQQREEKVQGLRVVFVWVPESL